MSETTGEPSGGWDLRRGDTADREALLALWAARFGDRQELTRWLDDALGDDEAAVAFVADGGDGPVGFAIVTLLEAQAARGYVRGLYPVDAFPERTAVIHALAVEEAHGDRAMGSALTEACIDWATDRAPMLLTVIWRREDHVDASVLTARYDIEEVLRIKGYYLDRREHCPDCEDTCTCDATVHVRPLSG